MRVLLLLVGLVLAVVLFIFSFSNSTPVDVNLMNTVLHDVTVAHIVVVSIAIGALVMGLIALIEGASIRIENRRLRREIQRQETEINFLRTQPAAGGRREPDDLDEPARTRPPAGGRTRAHPPSAPVYGIERDDADDDDDDDVYSGGRAV